MEKMKKSTGGSAKMDMLHGGLTRKILVFAIPLIASGILQQSFNSVDVAVLGRFDSHQALAAVGSNGMIISLIVNLFIGVSIGANVVIAHYIGRQDEQGIKNSVNTVASLAIVCGIALLLIGVASARPILEMISTPDDVIDLATLYLRIYFLGMPFLMIYNFGSAILRSYGDTKRPFYCLVAGGIVNVILNLVLVICFRMSVAGVAIATVVSNVISATLLVMILLKEPEPFRLTFKGMKISRPEMSKMLRIGMPAGLQGMVFSFSNVFIVSAINSFGSDASAGSAAAINYEYYCYFVVSAFCQAAVAFTSQNYGAGLIRRCDGVFSRCMALGIISCAILNILIVWQKGFFISFFTTVPEVEHYAYIRITTVLMWQSIASSYEVSGATLRGLGYSMTPTVLTIFGTCLLRLVWIYVFFNTSLIGSYGDMLTIYPITWIITGISVCVAYYIIRKRAYAPFRLSE